MSTVNLSRKKRTILQNGKAKHLIIVSHTNGVHRIFPLLFEEQQQQQKSRIIFLVLFWNKIWVEFYESKWDLIHFLSRIGNKTLTHPQVMSLLFPSVKPIAWDFHFLFTETRRFFSLCVGISSHGERECADTLAPFFSDSFLCLPTHSLLVSKCNDKPYKYLW